MIGTQSDLSFSALRNGGAILSDVRRLLDMQKAGELGGFQMPEDSNPGFALSSRDNYHYFTLPMALNYQRDSYKLWAAAKITAEDSQTAFVFDPTVVNARGVSALRIALLQHKLALQPNKHTNTWFTLCCTIVDLFGGDLRNLFRQCGYDVVKLFATIRTEHKKRFPYLSGEKIVNYWLYVMSSYTDLVLTNRGELSVAPDTHVIQASVRLGLVDAALAATPKAREEISAAWRSLLKGTGIAPIDIHTALWLWSRNGFRNLD